MLWVMTIGGFVLGCLVAYALVQKDPDQDDQDQDKDS